MKWGIRNIINFYEYSKTFHPFKHTFSFLVDSSNTFSEEYQGVSAIKMQQIHEYHNLHGEPTNFRASNTHALTVTIVGVTINCDAIDLKT